MSGVVEWLVPGAPPGRAIALRILVGAFGTMYLLVRFTYFAGLARHAPTDFAPVGIVSVLDAPLPASAVFALAALGLAAGLAFTLGRRLAVTGPFFLALLAWNTSYASSWGKILHSENVLVLHLAVVVLAGPRPDARAAGWALRAASIATALTYLLAGVTKLRSGGSGWLTGQALGDWLAWDALRKIELGSVHSPLAAIVASSPRILQLLALYTLVVELGAPVALANARLARRWALAAWFFHVGIALTMAIAFVYPLAGVAFAPLFEIERLPVLRRLVASQQAAAARP